jgi:hypothetical protein
MAETPTQTRTSFAPAVVRIVALWVLGVSLLKLASGSPNDLPAPVRELLFPALGADLAFRLTSAIELSVALVALLQPRLGWPLLGGLLAVFLVVLVQLVAAGAKSCGCFGPGLDVPPGVMLAIDGAGLAAILVARPWSSLPRGRPRFLWIALTLAAAWGLPWIALPPQEPAAPPTPAGEAWQPPAELPRYAELSPAAWVGKPLRETQLGRWLDVARYPDGTWILYRVTCDHCAAHLARIAQGFVSDPKIYVFVRLSEPFKEAERVVHELPPGEEAVLPRLEKGWVVEAPWELQVEGGIVTSAVFVQGE